MTNQQQKLEHQANKSTQYFKLQEQLKQHEISLFKYKLAHIQHNTQTLLQQHQTQTHRLTQKQNQTKQLHHKIQTLQNKIQETETQVESLDKQKITLDQQIIATKNNQQSLQDHYKETIDRIHYQKQDIHHITKETQQQQKDIQNLQHKINNHHQQQQQITHTIQQYKASQSSLNEASKGYEATLVSIKQQLKHIKQTLQSLNQKHHNLVESLVKEIDAIKTQVQKQNLNLNETNKSQLRYYADELHKHIQLLNLPNNQNNLKTYLEKQKQLPKNTLFSHQQTLVQQCFKLQQWLLKHIPSITSLIQQKDPFYNLIFATKGTYAKKESIHTRINQLNKQIDALENQFEKTSLLNQEAKNKVQSIEHSLINSQAQYNKYAHSIELLQQNLRDKQSNLQQTQNRTKNIHEELQKVKNLSAKIQSQLQQNIKHLNQLNKQYQTITHQSNKDMQVIGTQSIELHKCQDKLQALSKNIKIIQDKQHHTTLQVELLKRDAKHIHSQAKEKFAEDLPHQSPKTHPAALTTHPPKQIEQHIQSLKQQLQKLEPINPLAKSEYDAITQQLNETYHQKDDIQKSMQNLQTLLTSLDENASQQFQDIFYKINQEFNHVFQSLFEGGQASLTLTDPTHPLESGVDIKIQPPGKKFQSIHLFSGGEKSLIAIALMLSIFQIRPSPICLLDEVDAALDKENIQKLAKLLNHFKHKTQMILISHNEKTFTIIDHLYGITMNDGVSQAFSINFKKIQQKKYSHKNP